jgi:hypothetical protein
MSRNEQAEEEKNDCAESGGWRRRGDDGMGFVESSTEGGEDREDAKGSGMVKCALVRLLERQEEVVGEEIRNGRKRFEVVGKRLTWPSEMLQQEGKTARSGRRSHARYQNRSNRISIIIQITSLSRTLRPSNPRPTPGNANETKISSEWDMSECKENHLPPSLPIPLSVRVGPRER